MRYVTHALQRMVERGITQEDVEIALSRPIGDPEPGDWGNVVITGLVGGRRLAVVCSKDGLVVSAWWR
jgi:Domain of unknown function (DUF4258)